MHRTMIAAAIAALTGQAALAGITVDYTVDLGGNNNSPLNGLTAQGMFDISGNTLTVELTNNSTGVPNDFEVSDSLLVSVAFILPGGVSIVSGDSALIGAGSVGLGDWSGRGAGDSVAEEWLWTNDFGGDFLEAFSQVISTSNGQGGGDHTRFDGVLNGDVNGPFGGIAADPTHLDVPANQHAVSDSIRFTLTLSDTLTNAQLEALANGSVVEYGSDARYLGVPAPGAIGLLAIAGACGKRRRRAC